MNSFRINGGISLRGEVDPQGAKNEALQVLCAVLMTDDEIIIKNIPDIKDVNLLIELLNGMGVKVEKKNSTSYSFKASNIDLSYDGHSILSCIPRSSKHSFVKCGITGVKQISIFL